MAKTFDLHLKLEDPTPRVITSRGILYVSREGRLSEAKGTSRQFSLVEDSLDFDEEFSDTIQLSLADAIHGMARGSFECSVTEYELEGMAMKLYDIIDNHVPVGLIIVVEASGGKIARHHIERTKARALRGEARARIASLLGVPVEEIERLFRAEQPLRKPEGSRRKNIKAIA